jgi:hypothetical protein
MIMRKFPTPAELTSSDNKANRADAEKHFDALFAKVQRSEGKRFSYAAELMPRTEGGRKILIDMLAESGWKSTYHSDQRDGDFYWFDPK